jgi:hypothetical protein
MATATTTKKTTRKTPAKKAVAKKPTKFVPPETTEGTWQDTIVKSAVLKERAAKGDAKAGELLWSGAQQGITDWLPESDEDASAEGLYNTLLTLMGKARKGDASKITKVALAVKDAGLTMSSYTSLSRAYAAAREMLDAAPEQEREDNAAEDLSASISESAPKSTSSVDGAAKILLGAGIDAATEAIVAAVIDAAGSYDKAEPVLRSLARSLGQEIVGKKPKPEPKVKAPAKPKGEAVAKAKAKPASEKAKPVAKKAAPKPAQVEDDEPVDEDDIEVTDEGVEDAEDALLDEIEDEEDGEPEVVEAPVKKKAAPVVRRR